MPTTIVTMSRGDAARLPEWVRYHAGLGFDEFHILLDDPCDDSVEVLDGLRDVATIVVEVLKPEGYYHPQGLSAAERWERVKAWRVEHADEIASSGLPIVDALSWRQYRRLPKALETYTRRQAGSGWLALIDVDEFIVVGEGRTLRQLLDGATKPRIRLTSFNMDTRGWDGTAPLLETVTHRWSFDDMVAYGKGWPTRVKSLIRYEDALPLQTVHAINGGPFQHPAADEARLLHYKFPPMDMLPYPVEDRGAMSAWQGIDGGSSRGAVSNVPDVLNP